ncbi:hypothetical protein GCM10023189_11960 [Nibrella saemangeumensis]|uniref:Nuclease A inhibitor-like protein n=1 Tax=Nibrella saemangeumensis TaxID=1084526 RepID=A0ABP8ML50_9BACT
MEDKKPEENTKSPDDNSSQLNEPLEPLLTDLYYPSESDEPVTFITGPTADEGPLTDKQIREWLQVPDATPIEERPEADFWAPVTEEKDWYGEEEKARTETFKQVKATIEQHLTDRQFFRVGETEIDLYLLGRRPDGTRAGLKTMIVET